ncbi:hypothetical protein RHMOL_Rhmol06G0062100 [Rhododendron molle]|uniref:Uncharacterized protein n=2 Tax=Rhododendron molle TaxID=49168 RepID=A0ACC0NBA5_RHOML|nr:hypothetical protein RHMOL_Rhmol06G0062100 [Rhododendron molle]KAI8549913.1 hypothetical protein RHMOL_Rhmol06G0062100 [Rhododendron molle]
MQKQNILYHKAAFSFRKIADGQYNSGMSCIVPHSLVERCLTKSRHLKAEVQRTVKIAGLKCTKLGYSFQTAEIGLKCTKLGNSFQTAETKGVSNENPEEFSEGDDELCPAECVREFGTDDEFLRILEKAKKTNSLVVVDFYRTSCGSCKYIEAIFSKLCKGSGNQDSKVIFLKHNVIDEYDEQSEVAERLRIKAVPLFHFYKDGVLLEAFPTRDKERIVAAICKYTAPASPDI